MNEIRFFFIFVFVVTLSHTFDYKHILFIIAKCGRIKNEQLESNWNLFHFSKQFNQIPIDEKIHLF